MEASLADLLEFELWVQIANARGIMSDPQSLITAGHCFVCYGASTAQTMKLALLVQISHNHNAANQTDPQSLISQGACLECFGMVSLPKLMELVLLNQIAS